MRTMNIVILRSINDVRLWHLDCRQNPSTDSVKGFCSRTEWKEKDLPVKEALKQHQRQKEQ